MPKTLKLSIGWHSYPPEAGPQGKLSGAGLPIGFGVLLEQDTDDLADSAALGRGPRSDTTPE